VDEGEKYMVWDSNRRQSTYDFHSILSYFSNTKVSVTPPSLRGH